MLQSAKRGRWWAVIPTGGAALHPFSAGPSASSDDPTGSLSSRESDESSPRSSQDHPPVELLKILPPLPLLISFSALPARSCPTAAPCRPTRQLPKARFMSRRRSCTSPSSRRASTTSFSSLRPSSFLAASRCAASATHVSRRGRSSGQTSTSSSRQVRLPWLSRRLSCALVRR
jgi:hypothetical protein